MVAIFYKTIPKILIMFPIEDFDKYFDIKFR